ncbi:MAG: hypothetical protein QM484_13615 [Woeseiaceae bacterium]
MAIMYPESYTEIAKDIAKSWSGIGSNCILVAAPLTDPEHVFKMLSDISFQEKCGLDPDDLAVAYLPRSSYKTTEEFIRGVLKRWDIEVKDADYKNAELDILEDAVEILDEQGRIPILLLSQFHKAIDKLSWDLGAKLRDIEMRYGLCTVVELPIPLSRLRDRWQQNVKKETFICSEFGQGHNMVVLTGYKRNEVEILVKTYNIDQIYFEKILTWSGGLPGLVQWLLRLAKNSKSIDDFDKAVRKDSVEQCGRFLQWLDAPASDYYKKRISALWQGNASENEKTEIKGHGWKDILINRYNLVSSSSVGFSCTNSIGSDYSQMLISISKKVNSLRISEVDALIDGLSEAYRTEGNLKYILDLIPIWRLINEFSPDWEHIFIVSKKIENQLSNDESELAKRVSSSIKKWNNFSKNINNFIRISENKKEWRLSDCLSGRINGKKDSSLAAVQLVVHQLNEANKISDSDVALKSVLHIPEQIFQIYCGRKLQIPIWESQKFDDDVIEEVTRIWVGGDFRAPAIKTRLGFTHLLYIGWILMLKLDENERLFQDFSDIQNWSAVYGEIRNESSHSITYESSNKWKEFYLKCLELVDRLSIILTGNNSKEVLPRLDLLIEELANKN